MEKCVGFFVNNVKKRKKILTLPPFFLSCYLVLFVLIYGHFQLIYYFCNYILQLMVVNHVFLA